MATELDVSKSRRFDIAMSRRTRRSTSLVACFQDQYVPPLTQHRHQDAKLKTLFQCQDTDLHGLQQCEDAEQRLYEDEELKIPEAPLLYEGNEQKTPEQYQDEQEKQRQQYFDEEQKKQEQHHDEEAKKLEQYLDVEEKTPEKYQYVDEKTSEYQDEDQTSPNQLEDDSEEKIPEQYQDEEQQKAPQQCEDADEHPSEQYEEEEEQKAQQESRNMEQKTPKQRPGMKNLPAPPGVGDGMPRFSLQELIQEKQLPIREAKSTDRLGGHWENGLADHKVSGGGATGGATLAMVIKRPEGGKKSMGMIRRCVKALNQMIKAKHGSKKNVHL
ncbi:hypothetical protein ACP70R_004621 [Stipagrostis hirtigluma subsp. patula]